MHAKWDCIVNLQQLISSLEKGNPRIGINDKPLARVACRSPCGERKHTIDSTDSFLNHQWACLSPHPVGNPLCQCVDIRERLSCLLIYHGDAKSRALIPTLPQPLAEDV